MGNGAATPKQEDEDDEFLFMVDSVIGSNETEGSVTIEVVKGENMPNMDVGSLSDCYVTAKWTLKGQTAPGAAAIRGVTLKTLIRRDSLDPVWHENITFPFIPSSGDTLHLDVYDKDLVGTDDHIGTARVQYSVLKEKGAMELPLTMATTKKGAGTSTITIRMVCEVKENNHPPCQRRKILYLIRHGQSKWNVAQKKHQVGEMVKQHDHSLTLQGVEDAEELQKRWSTGYPQEATEFKNAGRVVCSPLTRAVQTALVSLQGLPALKAGGLTLLRNLREVKNFGSFDTVSKSSGDEIAKRAADELATVMDKSEVSAYFQGVMIRPYDAVNNWSNTLQTKENVKDTKRRVDALWQQIRYTKETVQVLVGHSHLFRFMLQHYLSSEFRKSKPEFAAALGKRVMENGACMRIVLDWDVPSGGTKEKTCPVIVQASLAFGTKLREEKSSESAAAAKPKDEFEGFKELSLSGSTHKEGRLSTRTSNQVFKVLGAI